jgi:hypothetical protein
MSHMLIMKKIIALSSLFLILTKTSLAQQDVISGEDFKKYGNNLKWVEVWTDNEYTVMSTKGTLASTKRLGYVFFLIHPDKGIISSHVVEGDIISFSQLFFVDENTFTVFYRKFDKVIPYYFSVSFSKDSGKVETSKITKDLRQTNDEVMFHFIRDNQLFFGSITKDKTKLDIREFAKDGDTKTRYAFDLPDSLSQILTSTTSISQTFSKSYQAKAFGYGDNIRIIITFNSAKNSKIYFLDFDLLNETINQISYLVEGSNNSIGVYSLGDIVFLVKSKTIPYKATFHYEFQLDILKYPTLELVKSYYLGNSSTDISFKTSQFLESVFNSNLYYTNYKFKNIEQGKIPVHEILKGLSKGIPYVNAERTEDGNYLLEIGSKLDYVASNGSKTTKKYFFGCIDSDYQPCTVPFEQKRPSEKIQEYLKSVQKENPYHYVFGNRFIILYFKKKKELSIKSF